MDHEKSALLLLRKIYRKNTLPTWALMATIAKQFANFCDASCEPVDFCHVTTHRSCIVSTRNAIALRDYANLCVHTVRGERARI